MKKQLQILKTMLSQLENIEEILTPIAKETSKKVDCVEEQINKNLNTAQRISSIVRLNTESRDALATYLLKAHAKEKGHNELLKKVTNHFENMQAFESAYASFTMELSDFYYTVDDLVESLEGYEVLMQGMEECMNSIEKGEIKHTDRQTEENDTNIHEKIQ